MYRIGYDVPVPGNLNDSGGRRKMSQWKILLLGDEEKALYHPLSRVLSGVRAALEPLGELRVCTDYAGLSVEDLKEYDVIVSYLDCPQELKGFDNCLAEYAEDGGRLLALHNGIITPPGSRIERVYGGNFITHPPYDLLQYHWKGKEDFSMEEEPYMVEEMDRKNKVFLQFVYKEETYTAGWYRKAGKGYCCFLSPGHDRRTTDRKVFQELLRECVQGLLE